MEYKAFGKTYVVRIDRGEEILSQVKQVCEAEKITLGKISGLGAVNKAVVGLFETATQEYRSTVMTGDFEITSLTGNITTMEGEVYLHVHANLAGADNSTFGGHLNEAVVSATCELILQAFEGQVNRAFDETIGLNLLDFS
ncbi:MAG: DNA-binding protein [Desulfobacterium sp.]|nr:DNA-binding protein [Desulfobacterium sp.]